MDSVLLRDALKKLQSLPHHYGPGGAFAKEQAVRQFNALLMKAKALYPNRVDIQSMYDYSSTIMSLVSAEEFDDAVTRLVSAVELRPPSDLGERFTRIALPQDTPDDIKLDMKELEGAIALGLHKTALLLAGSIAEALLLVRHPDKSERGPGLQQLVAQARKERLFGRDTLRSLDDLVDYRDLIHPRAEKRNKTFRNEGRVSAAINALGLLCHELEDIAVCYS